ncbi:MAG: PSD1 and planctomycete cytochrome C domain-containing protein, partial [Limisphaerales bacterium]
IQPLLAEHCFHCHGKDEQARKGRLRLDERDAALKGGKSDGPAIVPGQPDKSALMVRILTHDADELMPPPKEKKPVKPADVAKLRQWIADGAPYAGHWAFTAPVKPPLPAGVVAKHPVDAFIQARLKKERLTLSPAAAPETLCRRLHLDLIGLPPSPAALDAFVKEASARGLDAASVALTDELMKDKRFGEKWARHWLDAARYSDSNGYEKDLPRDQWIWREWVIGALNRDLPYDRFITEQIAGDLLPQRTQQQLVATGFLRNGMINEEGAIVPEQWRMEAMFDRLDTIGSGILGLSLKCAQCHTHKFDPITQTEYYGLFAFLNNTYEAQSWVYSDAEQQAVAKVRSGVAAVEARLKKAQPDWQKKMAAWEAQELTRLKQTGWSVVEAQDTHSSSELNHPTVLPDKSILVLGHRTINGDVHLLAEPKVEAVTGIRLEILRHDDLPFGGPGRSYKGTWALTELTVEAKKPGTNKWERLKLTKATSDFAEPAAGMEPEWENKSRDKDNKRTRGPAAFLADADELTAWRADRGPGRRNAESVAVAQFETPLTLPPGTKLKIGLLTNHGGDDNGPKNTQVGRFRVAFTHTPDPKVNATPYAAVLALQAAPDKRTPQQAQAIFDAWRVTVPELKGFNDEIGKQWKLFPEAMTSVLHLAERSREDARETHRLDRGVWDQPKEPVLPQVPAALHPLPKDAPPSRLTLAKWLTDPRSPLTARVAVNRMWQTLFGTGIVETTEDFGTRSPEPSHPELLDWLAVDFMEHGWSQKHLLRTLVTSAAYRQGTRVTPELLERDPKNRLLARGPRFRAEAEVVRDIALSAAGLLSDKFGGPSIFPPVPESVIEFNYFKPTYWKPAEDATRYSRALYIFRKRSMPDPAMSAFDAPTGDFTCTRRPRSNSPLAALTAMNEPVFIEASQALAQRVLREAGATDAQRADYAFRLCTSRLPASGERSALLKLLASRRERLRRGELKAGEIAFNPLTKPAELPPNATPNEIAAWSVVARVLLNLDETVSKN